MAEHHEVRPAGQSGALFKHPVSWICNICGLKSAQCDEASYIRHVEQIHSDLADEKRNQSESALDAWQRHIIYQAFSQGPTDSHHSNTPVSLRPLAEAGKVASFGLGGVDIQRLSIGSTRDAPDDSMVTVAGSRLGPSTPAASDEASRVAHAPRQSPSSRPRPFANRPNPGTRPSPRPIRPQPPQEAEGFSRFTSQSRPHNREQFPADDESRELKRKGTIANSQPSTPPSTSPRQQVPLPRQRGVINLPPDPRYPNLILQPDSRGISQEQLATEVRTIYSGLSNIESRCIKLVREQSIAAEKGPLPANIWRGLISLHRALLNDHHDFFLASQHPSAAPALHRLAVKYNMPARMWKHGIHSFLELLRHQLPSSLEYMISFIYLAYQMMSLLLETVPSFEDTWIECLGDLSRYRMAVEEEEPRDRETWCNVAKYWYCKAADRMPNVGRLYHHLAILARPNALQQVYLYSRSLISVQPFLSARESIQTVFDPLMKDSPHYIPEVDAAFIKTAACIFYRKYDKIEQPQKRFLELLDGQIGRVTSKWREFGVYIAGTGIGALMDFGNKSTMLSVFEQGNYLVQDQHSVDESDKMIGLKSTFQPDPESEKTYWFAADFFFATFSLVLDRPVDRNTHPYLHVVFAFILALTEFHGHSATSPELEDYITRFTHRVPWAEVSRFLNMLAKSENFDSRFETFNFLRPEEGDGGPLPEDYLLRGLIFTRNYFPSDFFVNAELDDERLLEIASTTRKRSERLLWIGYKLAQTGCFSYDSISKTWSPNTSSRLVQPQDPDMSHSNTHSLSSQPMEGVEAISMPADIRPTVPLVSAQSPSFDTLEISEKIGQWTTIVIDLQIMTVNGEVFERLVCSRWTVLIPTLIWEKLQLLAKHLEDPESKAADAALYMVRKAVANKKDVKIVNQTFEDVTQEVMDVESYSPETPSGTVSPAQTEEDEEAIIGITRRASDLKERTEAYTEALASHPNAKPVALLSDNSSIISKAKRAGLVVLASEVFRGLLKNRLPAPEAPAQSERITTQRIEGLK